MDRPSGSAGVDPAPRYPLKSALSGNDESKPAAWNAIALRATSAWRAMRAAAAIRHQHDAGARCEREEQRERDGAALEGRARK
jgi:hypothetical protein